MKHGKFLSFEGADGVGKTTQIAMAQEFLTHKNQVCLLTREPGGTKFGMELRKLLVEKHEFTLDPMESLLLLLAARHAHYHQVIAPALTRGDFVLCDRFHDSTLAYQVFGEGLDQKQVAKISQLALGKIQPDVTFLLELPDEHATSGLRRALERNNHETRFESMGSDFQQRVRRGFQILAAQNPKRIITINAHQTPEQVHSDITQHLQQKFKVLA